MFPDPKHPENRFLDPALSIDQAKAYFDSINNPNTRIYCYQATYVTMLAGGGRITRRNIQDKFDLIPCDWVYIANDAHQHWKNDMSDKPWQIGLEGENLIYAGYMGCWGHFNPVNEYLHLATWTDMVGSWTNSQGDKAIPILRMSVDFPMTGIASVEDK